jgi:hypothetical protein
LRIRATCLSCKRDFTFMELQPFGPWAADRCPSCNGFIGARGGTAVQAHLAALALVDALEQLARYQLNFQVDADSVLAPIRDALVAVTAASRSKRSDTEKAPGAKTVVERLRVAASPAADARQARDREPSR